MRTRRSPRNQDRLWKALGGSKDAPPTPTCDHQPIHANPECAGCRIEWDHRYRLQHRDFKGRTNDGRRSLMLYDPDRYGPVLVVEPKWRDRR